MATIRVSDFTSFISAVTTSNADVVLDSDIDANGWTPQVTNWTCKSVDGGGHAIRNIQHTVSGGYSLFRLTNTTGCTINNVKFLNLVLTPGVPWGSSFIYGYIGTNYVRNCEFQGLMQTHSVLSGAFYNISQCTFSQELSSYGTVINADGVGLSNPAREVVSECYFDLNASTGEYNTNNVINFTSPDHSTVSNCYFKGYLKVPSNNTVTVNGVIHNCVINVDFTGNSNVTVFKIGNTSIELSGVSLYNTTKVDSGLLVTAQENLVGLSDTDLRYPGGLTAIPPTGFPLLV